MPAKRHANKPMTLTTRSHCFLRLALFAWLPVGVSTEVLAQYQITSWTVDAGLPQNSINDILQTREGYLWLTTFDGLVRYDGVRFIVFNKSNTLGLLNNRLLKLFEDGEGNLWIRSEPDGLIRYRDGVFTTYTTADGLPHNNVRGFAVDRDGNPLIITLGGIARWQQGRFVPDAAAGDALLPPDMYQYQDRSGALWYRNRATLYRCKAGTFSSYTTRQGLSSVAIQAYCEDRDGNLWMGTSDAGLNRLKDGRITVYNQKDGLPAFGVSAIYQDHLGTLWVGTAGGGLCQFKGGRFTTYTKAQGLSSDDISSITEDREGNLWVGTRINGLNRLRKSLITVYSQKDGLSAPVVYPIYEDRAGNIWLGTTAGLTRFKDGVCRSYTRKDGLVDDNVAALCEDGQGRLWVGVLGGGYWLKDDRLTPFSERIIPIRTTPQVIYQDREGTLWIGTERGLFKYREGNMHHYTTADGLVSNDVKDLYEDPQGRLWVATYGGLSCMAGDRFSNFTDRDGLASNAVRTIYQDGDGVLWIGTYDGGLSRFQDGRFTNYTTRVGLFNDGVFRILEDDRGNFWMSCNRGIFRARKQQLNDFVDGKVAAIDCIAYGKQDGLLNVECNGGRQPAGIKARDGKLWFPTFDGAAVFDPEAVPVNNEPPLVRIEELVLDHQQRAVADVLDLRPGENNLEIQYTGLSFVNPEHMRFKYILEGLDPDWIDVGSRRTAYYSHLPPGQYRFTVIAANSDGVWNHAGASLRVIVHPPFWRTGWFIAVTLAALVATAWLAYRHRIASLKRLHAVQTAFSNQLIESQEQERKRIAAELHDSLSQSLSIIRSRASLCLTRLDDQQRAREQIDEIEAAAAYALDEVREIAHNLRPVELDRLGLTEALQAMARKVDDSTPIALTTAIDPIDGCLSSEAEINLYRIVQEGLNNITRHSGATAAWVAIKRQANNMQITIRDNGKGFVPTGASGRGFGLLNITERARMLGGKPLIHSAPGQGTTITINVALKGTDNGQHDPHFDRR